MRLFASPEGLVAVGALSYENAPSIVPTGLRYIQENYRALSPRGIHTTTAGAPATLDWKQLYQLALVELDPAKLPQRIADARVAVLDRIEDTLKNPGIGEQQMLNDALNGLRVLRQEYDRRLQRYGEPRNAQANRSVEEKAPVQRKSA